MKTKTNSAFTLVELLGVLILLGVLALIAFPAIDNAIKNSRQKAYDSTIYGIVEAAKTYRVKNNLKAENGIISIPDLIEDGLLKKQEVINPQTNESLTGYVIYTWNSQTNQYNYEYSDEPR